MNIQIKLNIDTNKCNVIKYNKINHKKDKLAIGIYQPNIFKKNMYIICCNRITEGQEATLDYTKYSQNLENAFKMYNEMIKEIYKDLEV